MQNQLACVVLLAAAMFASESVRAIEQPEFHVVAQIGAVEVRKYPPQIVARTLVTAPFSNAGNQGFRRLAGYIFGGNAEDQKIAMTAPVMLEPAPSPKSQYWVAFNMPSEHALEDLPVPDDARVSIEAMPERYLAVLRYKGSWSEARYREHESILLASVEENDSWKKQGPPSWARYDPPFALWFMRTNEVGVEVIPLDEAMQ